MQSQPRRVPSWPIYGSAAARISPWKSLKWHCPTKSWGKLTPLSKGLVRLLSFIFQILSSPHCWLMLERNNETMQGTIGKLCLSNSIVFLMPVLAFIHSYWFGKLLLIAHTRPIKLHLWFSFIYFCPVLRWRKWIVRFGAGLEKGFYKNVWGGLFWLDFRALHPV